MMRTVSFLAAFLLAIVMIIEGFAVPAVGKEVFKDEAGRVIYTIDDDGMVSMFENSSTDITLSVKRGLREKMYPILDDISPSRVQAGTSTNLKLRGRDFYQLEVVWPELGGG